MKKHLFIGCVCLLCSLADHAQEITFAETEYDFGTIEEVGGDVSHDFPFTNTGDKPLFISHVVTSCGCTSAEWEKGPYQPGEKGVIRITYHPEGRLDEHLYLVGEVWDDQKARAVLTITGNVKLSTHPAVGFFDPTKGQRGTPIVRYPSDDFELILQRLRDDLHRQMPVQKLDELATRLLMTMTSEGRWPYIDYACFFRTTWDPDNHLANIKTIALAYTHPESALYGNHIVFQAIQKGMDAWFEANPESHNWWHNTISSPQAMAHILALMEAGAEKLSPETVRGIMTKKGNGDPRKWTGANKQDIAIHHLVRGCVLKNDSIVSVSAKEFYDPIRITHKEGIQKDMSYQQHGPQLYIGGYGIVFVSNIAGTAGYFRDTKYALGNEQLGLFSDFVRNTYLNVFRSRYMDFSVGGRSISRRNALKSGINGPMLENLASLDTAHAVEYITIKQRIDQNDATIGRTSKNKMFECSDYMLHNRKNFDFSVRAASTRTYCSESGNGENLLGTYLSEGATDIRVFGDEYYNIFPVWEWDKIPGTTTSVGELRNTHGWGVFNTTDFVGGVSDGLNGVMTYLMDNYGVEAKKSWFFFDGEIVCLGADISSEEPTQVSTSVNQCHLFGDVYLAGKKGGRWKTLATGTKAEKVMRGKIWHNQVGYYFPEKTNIVVKNTRQTGNWAKINFNEKDEEVSMPVFNLWVNHGVRPHGATYAYILVPGISKEDFWRYCPTVKIESNTSEVQAVSGDGGNEVQAVFYDAGTLKVGRKSITVKEPCVVYIKNLKREDTEILVKDPTQKRQLEARNIISIK